MLGYYQPRLRKHAVWSVFAVYLLAVVAMAGLSLLVAFMYAAIRRRTTGEEISPEMLLEPDPLLLQAFAGQFGFLLVTLSASLLSPLGIIRRLRLGRSTLSWLGYLTLPVGMLSLNWLFQSLISFLKLPEGGVLQVLHDTFLQLTPSQVTVALLVIGILPAFAEEFLFRGYIQSRISVRWGRWIAILIASLLFGLSHFDWIQSPITFLMGLYLGYVADRAGSIRPAMFAHMFNNSAVLLFTWFTREAATHPSATPDTFSPKMAALNALVAASVLALCCVYIRYRVHPPIQSDSAELLTDSGDAISSVS
jgi:membrane protease YdiL (CAAX protease family)